MKKNYKAPSLEITKFETEDILNASIPTPGGPGSIDQVVQGEGETTRLPSFRP